MIVGNVTSYDVPTNVQDVSEIFYAINHPLTPLLNEVALGNSITSADFHWWESVLKPTKTTVFDTYTAADGNLDVTTSAAIRVDMIIQVGITIFIVTAINTATNVSVTVISNDANHAIGESVDFLNNARKENSTAEDSDYDPDLKVINVPQIMDDKGDVSGTEQATNREVEPGSLIDIEIEKKLRRLYYEMNRMLWRNPRVAPTVKTTARITGGVRFFTDLNGYVPSSAVFSVTNLDAFLYIMQQEYGNMLTQMWMNPAEISRFKALNTSQIRVTRDDTVVGDKKPLIYESDKGYMIALKTDPHCPVKEINLFDSSQVKIKPLQTRQFFVKEVASGADGIIKRIIGEYMFEVNPSKTMGRFTIT